VCVSNSYRGVTQARQFRIGHRVFEWRRTRISDSPRYVHRDAGYDPAIQLRCEAGHTQRFLRRPGVGECGVPCRSAAWIGSACPGGAGCVLGQNIVGTLANSIVSLEQRSIKWILGFRCDTRTSGVDVCAGPTSERQSAPAPPAQAHPRCWRRVGNRAIPVGKLCTPTGERVVGASPELAPEVLTLRAAWGSECGCNREALLATSQPRAQAKGRVVQRPGPWLAGKVIGDRHG
jgi:hypothetical protein